jgi:predicted ATPase
VRVEHDARVLAAQKRPQGALAGFDRLATPDEEMAMLMRCVERARQGDGQLVLIVGEPGLGKSRLIEEFHARVREMPHTWAEWSWPQLLQNMPLHPVTEWAAAFRWLVVQRLLFVLGKIGH